MPHIAIGPEFFCKARADYADWKWALVREFMQNSIDCGSKNIRFEAVCDGGKTTVTVENDGAPMDRETLTGKLLSLGGSGKSFANGAVGGFGKAKELLYFGWDSYEIVTGGLKVTGRGASYDIEPCEPFSGTRSQIVIDGDLADELIQKARRFVALANVAVTFHVDGESIDGRRMHKGSFRRALTFGRVYTNKSTENLLVVRIGGTPMFTRWIDLNRCAVLELSGNSADTLTANRDGLRGVPREELDAFLDELSVDKKSALDKPTETTVEVFDGPVLVLDPGRDAAAPSDNVPDAFASAGCDIPTGIVAALAFAAERCDNVTTAPCSPPETVSAASKPRLGVRFVLRNETGRATPKRFHPDTMSPDPKRLLVIWTNLLVEMHRVLHINKPFSVGFVISDDAEAMYGDSARTGRVFYLNPTLGGKMRKFGDDESRCKLILTAAHEVLHGMGYGRHDEIFAAKLTDLAAKLNTTAARRRFQKCFRSQ